MRVVVVSISKPTSHPAPLVFDQIISYKKVTRWIRFRLQIGLRRGEFGLQQSVGSHEIGSHWIADLSSKIEACHFIFTLPAFLNYAN
jgi:hypothetical protein